MEQDWLWNVILLDGIKIGFGAFLILVMENLDNFKSKKKVANTR